MASAPRSDETVCWEAILAASSGIGDVGSLVGCRQPVNVVGSETAVEALGWKSQSAERRGAVRVIPPGSLMADTLAQGAGMRALSRRITAEIQPRSSTVVLDPGIARLLIEDQAALETLSVGTTGSVLMPLEVDATSPCLVYSDVFSFPETDANGTGRWIWTERAGRAFCTIAHVGGAGEYGVAFTLTAASPGTFTIRLGESVLQHPATVETPSRRFQLLCRLTAGANTIEIDFDGLGTRPASEQDQRQAVYFCVGDVVVTARGTAGRSAPNTLPGCRVHDDAIRRIAHAAGFFEVDTVACSRPELVWRIGLRSCFDYRQEYRFRDYRRFSVPQEATVLSRDDLPACVWYRFRKTPHAGSEWSGYMPPRSSDAAILATEMADTSGVDALDECTRELVRIRHVLAERTHLLEESNKALQDRSHELEETRATLAERTRLLQESNEALEECNRELIAIRGLVEERTDLLEKSNRALEACNQDLAGARQDLETRTRSLHESIASITENLVSTRDLLVDRTAALEHAMHERDALTSDLATLQKRMDGQLSQSSATRITVEHVANDLTTMITGPLAGPPLILTRQRLRSICDGLVQIRASLDGVARKLQESSRYSP